MARYVLLQVRWSAQWTLFGRYDSRQGTTS